MLKEKHGKTTLPGGNAELLIQSINRLASEFVGDYKILTGHREETTLEHERRFNPFITKN